MADGLANDFVNLAYCDHRGTLWFGNLNGLLRLFPEPDRPSTLPAIQVSRLRKWAKARRYLYSYRRSGNNNEALREERVMKTRSMLIKSFLAGLLLCVIVIIWAGWTTNPVGAADHRDRRGFGLVSLNPAQVARLNVFSLRINETQPGESQSQSNAEEARPRRITIAFDIYAPESGRAAPGDTSCPTPLQFMRRKSCEIVLARGNAVTWDFTAPPEGAVIRAVVNPATFDPHIISSLEIMEGERTTHFINPNVIDP